MKPHAQLLLGLALTLPLAGAPANAGTVLSLPTLTGTVTSGFVRLSWPAAYGDYQLVSRSDLNPGAWESFTNSPAINGAQREISLPATGDQRFVRLSKPAN